MNTAILNDLRAYWEKLRGDRIAPYRAELDPRSFEAALEHMFILERLNPTQVRIRLAGMRICEIMGMEVRGMPPEALIDPDHRQSLTDLLDSVFNTPAIAEIDLEMHDPSGIASDARMLILPLRSDFGEMTRAIGCLVTGPHTGRSPVAFSIVDKRVLRIRAAADASGEAMPGFEDEKVPFRPAEPRPQLRAVPGTPGSEDRRKQSSPVENDRRSGTDRRRDHLRVVK
jgi:hypothetical protein